MAWKGSDYWMQEADISVHQARARLLEVSQAELRSLKGDRVSSANWAILAHMPQWCPHVPHWFRLCTIDAGVPPFSSRHQKKQQVQASKVGQFQSSNLIVLHAWLMLPASSCVCPVEQEAALKALAELGGKGRDQQSLKFWAVLARWFQVSLHRNASWKKFRLIVNLQKVLPTATAHLHWFLQVHKNHGKVKPAISVFK